MSQQVAEIDTQDDFLFTPNPTLNAETWQDQYPPITSSSQWLINKFTGEIYPNTPEFARRSDCLEPYLGELSNAEAGDTAKTINQVLNPAPKAKSKVQVKTDDELDEL